MATIIGNAKNVMVMDKKVCLPGKASRVDLRFTNGNKCRQYGECAL
jgi:D-ribose pyranose/furanose isomerase RbsD